ncbi:MAG TPA: DUF3305 domain-containing protein [Limnobacter sp.]|nr:DUF3305 domain-containing protein [Limnobacter sp.]
MSSNFLVLGEYALQVKIGQVKQSSPWQPFRWELLELAPAEPALIAEPPNSVQLTKFEVFQDELQGYFLNLDSDKPCVFFLLRYPDENKTQRPTVFAATVSYDEAARWMDSNEEVQTLGMPTEMAAWLAQLVDARYQPEPKRRARPQSFLSPDQRG